MRWNIHVYFWNSGEGAIGVTRERTLDVTGEEDGLLLQSGMKEEVKNQHVYVGFLCLCSASLGPRLREHLFHFLFIHAAKEKQQLVPERIEVWIRKMKIMPDYLIVQKIMAVLHACLIVESPF